jgi:hypothetical protein
VYYGTVQYAEGVLVLNDHASFYASSLFLVSLFSLFLSVRRPSRG